MIIEKVFFFRFKDKWKDFKPMIENQMNQLAKFPWDLYKDTPLYDLAESSLDFALKALKENIFPR